MEVNQIVEELDAEISILTRVRILLTGGGENIPSLLKKRKKRVMSAEARERIAAAQRKRWAAQKKTAK